MWQVTCCYFLVLIQLEVYMAGKLETLVIELRYTSKKMCLIWCSIALWNVNVNSKYGREAFMTSRCPIQRVQTCLSVALPHLHNTLPALYQWSFNYLNIVLWTLFTKRCHLLGDACCLIKAACYVQLIHLVYPFNNTEVDMKPAVAFLYCICLNSYVWQSWLKDVYKYISIYLYIYTVWSVIYFF